MSNLRTPQSQKSSKKREKGDRGGFFFCSQELKTLLPPFFPVPSVSFPFHLSNFRCGEEEEEEEGLSVCSCLVKKGERGGTADI